MQAFKSINWGTYKKRLRYSRFARHLARNITYNRFFVFCAKSVVHRWMHELVCGRNPMASRRWPLAVTGETNYSLCTTFALFNFPVGRHFLIHFYEILCRSVSAFGLLWALRFGMRWLFQVCFALDCLLYPTVSNIIWLGFYKFIFI